MPKRDCKRDGRHYDLSHNILGLKRRETLYLIIILATFRLMGTGAMKALTCIAIHVDINVMDNADNAIFCLAMNTQMNTQSPDSGPDVAD